MAKKTRTQRAIEIGIAEQGKPRDRNEHRKRMRELDNIWQMTRRRLGHPIGQPPMAKSIKTRRR